MQNIKNEQANFIGKMHQGKSFQGKSQFGLRIFKYFKLFHVLESNILCVDWSIRSGILIALNTIVTTFKIVFRNSIHQVSRFQVTAVYYKEP